MWDQERIQAILTNGGIQWKFNPPAASHQRGVWERLISSIRRILRSLIGERLLNDEVLRTFLVEIEKILNDRPITSVSSDPQDFEALMPNHILLLRRNQSFCLDVFEESDKFKARWKHVHLKLPFMQPVGRRRVPDSQLVSLQKQFLLLLNWSEVVTLKAF